MSEWNEIKARFKRPLSALFIAGMLLLFSRGLFDAADRRAARHHRSRGQDGRMSLHADLKPAAEQYL